MSNSANSSEFNLAEIIIERFGGMASMERVTPYTYSQIRNMKRSGTIAEAERPVILRCAKEAGVNVTPWTFIEHLICLAQ